MENPKTAIAERIKESANVLVTVSANPSVDQLSAAIGLTLVLNKLGKHATAVFSGNIPSTIEFLQPEKTLEKDTNSLRDFIIALDKSKADKLRYKVEDKLVKIFITPYKTSISDKDLEFSQGDFNVDLVLALGVHQREELDQAIIAHGRILHDATVASINIQSGGELGSINWVDPTSSSLCELIAGLSDLLKVGVMDSQIATAFLTGIVAETARFSNAKTTSETMSMSSKLMTAGANQQLVATKLQEVPKPAVKPAAPTAIKSTEPKVAEDGSLEIDHGESTSPIEQIQIDEHGTLHLSEQDKAKATDVKSPFADDEREVLTKPPSLGGQLTANSEPENLDSSVDPLSLPAIDTPLLSHKPALPSTPPLPQSPPPQPAPAPAVQPVIAPPAPALGSPSPKLDAPSGPSLYEARNAVQQAASAAPNQPMEPIASLNARPLGQDLRHDEPPAAAKPLPQPVFNDADVPSDPGLPAGFTLHKAEENSPHVISLPTNLVPPDQGLPHDNTAAPLINASSPPPVPPPMMPPAFGTPVEDDTQPSDMSGVPL